MVIVDTLDVIKRLIMLLLGIDVGTSSIKVSVVDAQTQQCIASAQFPETERSIKSLEQGWAEQSPLQWWDDIKQAIKKANASGKYDPKNIKAIGIAYQMHGLVIVDRDKQVLRDSIIWCDSRAVKIGNEAFNMIGKQSCLSNLLNSPGNFTATKLAWVKQYEPLVYFKADKVMLPGDYIAMKFTGEITTTVSALSEGIFWDFKNERLSEEIFKYFDFKKSLIPTIKNVFEPHGYLSTAIAEELSLSAGIPVSYKAGDQPNNALSLNVMEPGEVAATAGTSGVIYGISKELVSDRFSRINSFAHVNHTNTKKHIGVLLCINGVGILNKWIKNVAGSKLSYADINKIAATIEVGSSGLFILPFGNGAERILKNKIVNAHIHNIDLNKHTDAHLFRAAQEGIAFSFRYGLDIMRENGMNPSIIRAGKANMFLSDVFTEAFVNATNIPVELYNCDGSIGAALGAGIGAGVYSDTNDAFSNFLPIKLIEPQAGKKYDELYKEWKSVLEKIEN